MSFNSKSGPQPHAYVAYVDGEKETVPLNFIYKFPSTWRTAGWDKNYLYKVFWSPINDESPSDFLNRKAEIPVFDGIEKCGPGYYRASVELVKDTLEELEEQLDSGKRLSIGLSRYKYTSNDLGQSQQQVQAVDKAKQHKKVSDTISKNKNNKSIALKNKTSTGIIKKSKAPVHDLPQVQSLRESIQNHLPKLSDGDRKGGMESVLKSTRNDRKNKQKGGNGHKKVEKVQDITGKDDPSPTMNMRSGSKKEAKVVQVDNKPQWKKF